MSACQYIYIYIFFHVLQDFLCVIGMGSLRKTRDPLTSLDWVQGKWLWFSQAACLLPVKSHRQEPRPPSVGYLSVWQEFGPAVM